MKLKQLFILTILMVVAYGVFRGVSLYLDHAQTARHEELLASSDVPSFVQSEKNAREALAFFKSELGNSPDFDQPLQPMAPKTALAQFSAVEEEPLSVKKR